MIDHRPAKPHPYRKAEVQTTSAKSYCCRIIQHDEAPQILLHHHLKALKLPTFLREYEKVAKCASEGVDHVRYLTRLVELELIDRE